jgi:hypothetical protein
VIAGLNPEQQGIFQYAALYLLKAILINKIVEATVIFRLFEDIAL